MIQVFLCFDWLCLCYITRRLSTLGQNKWGQDILADQTESDLDCQGQIIEFN